MTQIAEVAGLEPDQVSPHILRHTFAKTLIDWGVSLEKVQALLGHASIITTTRYTTPRQEDLEAVVDELV